MLEIITENDSQLTLIAKLHALFIKHELDDSVLLINDTDIWPSVKENFLKLVNDQSYDDMWILSRLRQCIIKMDEKRKIFLDGDCLEAYRKRTEKFPTFYIKNFVFLGAYSSHSDYNTIACEPFWKQIFIDNSQFENFLKQCKSKEIENMRLVWNYWLLYKDNGFRPLVYNDQGPVQEKIDNGLVYEIKKLERIKDIEKNVASIPDDTKGLSDKQILGYKTSLLDYNRSLEDIDLYISLRGKILDDINSKLHTYSA